MVKPITIQYLFYEIIYMIQHTFLFITRLFFKLETPFYRENASWTMFFNFPLRKTTSKIQQNPPLALPAYPHIGNAVYPQVSPYLSLYIPSLVYTTDATPCLSYMRGPLGADSVPNMRVSWQSFNRYSKWPVYCTHPKANCIGVDCL